MKDGFTTSDVFFAAGLSYAFGDDALTKIEFPEQGKTNFSFDAPSLDCQEYFTEFKAGTFAITDLMSYVRSYTRLIGRLKQMRKNGETEWCSPSWIAGRG